MGFSNALRVNGAHAAFAKIEQGFSRRNHPARATRTAAEVIERIKRYEDLGYDEFAFWIDSGMSSDRKKESLARFINDVMPAFQ